MDSYRIVQDLWKANRTFCSPDFERSVAYLSELLPFADHAFPSDAPSPSGWRIPPRWAVEEAWIRRAGELIYDASTHPLAVVGASAPFEGSVSRGELLRHLHVLEEGRGSETAIPFHYAYQLRPWTRDWGFCVPRGLARSLKPGDYEVCIRTVESRGVLHVLEHTHAGDTSDLFVIVTSLNHQGMANANLAGCAAAVDLFRGLQGTRTKFSYRLVVTPPPVGSVYYLEALSEEEKARIRGALFVGMMGSETPFALQASARGNAVIDEQAEAVLAGRGAPYRTGPFRSIVGYDEVAWEAHGIPMASLTRFPFPEYHTSDDTIDIVSPERLTEGTAVLRALVERIDRQTLVERTVDGLPCLSHPSYDLFPDGPTAGGDGAPGSLRAVMDHLSVLDRPSTVDRIGRRFGVDEGRLRPYLKQWEARGLLRLA